MDTSLHTKWWGWEGWIWDIDIPPSYSSSSSHHAGSHHGRLARLPTEDKQQEMILCRSNGTPANHTKQALESTLSREEEEKDDGRPRLP